MGGLGVSGIEAANMLSSSFELQFVSKAEIKVIFTYVICLLKRVYGNTIQNQNLIAHKQGFPVFMIFVGWKVFAQIVLINLISAGNFIMTTF